MSDVTMPELELETAELLPARVFRLVKVGQLRVSRPETGG